MKAQTNSAMYNGQSSLRYCFIASFWNTNLFKPPFYMGHMDFTVELCKDKGGWAAKPKVQTKLDLGKISSQFTTLIKTPILLVVKIQGHDVIVHGHGELIFKDLEDREEIRKLAEKVYHA